MSQVELLDPETTNPFASPAKVTPTASRRRNGYFQKRTFSTAFCVWATTCTVCAFPSFVLALHLCSSPAHYWGMLAGVALFSVAFAFLDFYVVHPKLESNLRVLRALRYGYQFRLVASIVFPFAIMLDVLLGGISIGIVGSIPVLGNVVNTGPNAAAQLSQQTVFFGILLTTIIQGLLINAAVLCICPFLWLFARRESDQVERELDTKLAELSSGTYEDPFSYS